MAYQIPLRRLLIVLFVFQDSPNKRRRQQNAIISLKRFIMLIQNLNTTAQTKMDMTKKKINMKQSKSC